MPFNSTWHELLNHLDELSEGASMVTPLSHRRFRIANTQEQYYTQFIPTRSMSDLGYMMPPRLNVASLLRVIGSERPGGRRTV
jgi:hypothetical protein